VSTSGYVVVDDTHHPQFDDSEWPWVINQTFPQPDPSSCSKVQPLKVWIRVTLSQDLLITKLPDHYNSSWMFACHREEIVDLWTSV